MVKIEYVNCQICKKSFQSEKVVCQVGCACGRACSTPVYLNAGYS